MRSEVQTRVRGTETDRQIKDFSPSSKDPRTFTTFESLPREALVSPDPNPTTRELLSQAKVPMSICAIGGNDQVNNNIKCERKLLRTETNDNDVGTWDDKVNCVGGWKTLNSISWKPHSPCPFFPFDLLLFFRGYK